MFLGVVAAVRCVSSQHPFFAIFCRIPRRSRRSSARRSSSSLIGVADDIWDLDWMTKLAGQFVAAGLIAWFGQLQIFSLPIGGLTVGSSWVSFTLTVFAIVLVMNAINFIDGLDGLVAGVASSPTACSSSTPTCWCATRREHLLQPRVVHRGRARSARASASCR